MSEAVVPPFGLLGILFACQSIGGDFLLKDLRDSTSQHTHMLACSSMRALLCGPSRANDEVVHGYFRHKRRHLEMRSSSQAVALSTLWS